MNFKKFVSSLPQISFSSEIDSLTTVYFSPSCCDTFTWITHWIFWVDFKDTNVLNGQLCWHFPFAPLRDNSLNLFPRVGCHFSSVCRYSLPCRLFRSRREWRAHLLGLPRQMTAGWAASATHICFLTVLEAGRARSRCQQSGFLLRPLSLVRRWQTSHCVLIRPFLCADIYICLPSFFSSHKYSGPIGLGPPSLWPRLTLFTFLKTPSPNRITLRTRASTCDFWGDTIQFITNGKEENKGAAGAECRLVSGCICALLPTYYVCVCAHAPGLGCTRGQQRPWPFSPSQESLSQAASSQPLPTSYSSPGRGWAREERVTSRCSS